MTEKEHDINKNTIWEQNNIIDNKAAENLDHMINNTLHETQKKLWNLQNTIIENNINTQVEQNNAIQGKNIETDNAIDWVNKDILFLKEQIEIENQNKTTTKRTNKSPEHNEWHNKDTQYKYPTQTEIDANRLEASQNPTLLWQQASLNNYKNPIVRAFMTPIIRSAQRLWKKTLET